MVAQTKRNPENLWLWMVDRFLECVKQTATEETEIQHYNPSFR